MSEPAAVRRDRRRSVGRVVAGGVLSWVLVLGGLRAFVVQAEHCGDPTAEELRAAADAAVGWFVRNQRDDGAWLYRYDRDTDTDVGGYNITRHAGVTMSLEQAAGAGLAESEAAAASAERGIEWALDRLYEGPGWRAFAGEGDGQFGSGASALLTAALVLRRERTGDERYDDVLARPRRLPHGDDQRARPGVRPVRPGDRRRRAGQLEQVLHRRERSGR